MELNDKQKETLDRALFTYGVTAQLDQVNEECGELIVAINKIKRAGLVGFMIAKPQIDSNQKSVFAYHNLCSEVADVRIMLHQLELMLDPKIIQISVDRKIDRLEERLNKSNKI